MRETTIEVKLNTASINKAIRELEAYKKRIYAKLLELIDVMCMDGEDYACEYLTHVDTGETLGSIMGYRQGNCGIIEAGGAAIWIEFGTGTLHNGPGDPFHDRGELSKQGTTVYDWGEYGQGQGNGKEYPNGWFFYNEKTGRAGWTEGITMEPFMQNTAERLSDEFKATAQKVFSKK